MRQINFGVVGQPVPQGSTRAFAKRGKVFTTNDPQGTIARWRADIRASAGAALQGGPLFEGPVTVVLVFSFRRPQSHRTKTGVAKGAPAFPVPDVDKLTRAVLDGLTGIVWQDDRQVTAVHAIKNYVLDNPSGLWAEVTEGTWG